MTITDIAAICHEVNRRYCVSIGDMSQPVWEEAPEWQRASARDGVEFHLANPDAGPEASHNNWMGEKLRDGWRYGPRKVPAKKEHPCMVEFTDLPPEQQMKDVLFRNVVHALKPALT